MQYLKTNAESIATTLSLCLYPLKNIKKPKFSDVFRAYRKRPAV